MQTIPSAVVGEAHEIELLEGARALFPAMIFAIDAARIEVLVETYIFDTAGSAAEVAEALIRAAARGVACRLVIDGIGTGRVPAPWPERFERAGVQLRVFAPLGRLGLLLPSRWRRMHRKLCVVDGVTAFCGGINILDDWLDPNWGRLEAPRLDFAVCVHGELAAEIRRAMQKLWQRIEAMGDVRRSDLPKALKSLRTDPPHADAVAKAQASEQQRVGALPPPRERGEGGERGERSERGEQGDAAGHAPDHAAPAASIFKADAVLLLRDNLRNRNRIERAYRKAIGGARHDIVIASAYFLPGRKLRRALVHAALRGVRVQLLLQGRYEYFLQFHGVRPVYHKLLAAGIEIHEYAPSFLHAKVAVIDAGGARPWATVGSSNLDPLSLLLAREANVAIEAGEFCEALRVRLHDAIEQEGRKVSAVDLANRPWHERLLDRIAAGLMRVALVLAGAQRY
ncbi:MAG: phospholipase D-like domain-containing protein [Burkholderiales bacterium]